MRKTDDMNAKHRICIGAAILLAGAVLVAGSAHAQRAAKEKPETYRDKQNFIMQKVDKLLKTSDGVMKQKGLAEKTLEEVTWDQAWEEWMGTSWDFQTGGLLMRAKEQKLDVKTAQEWVDTNAKFLKAVRSDGYQVLYWRCRLRDQINQMKEDIEDYDDETKPLVKQIEEAEGVLTAVDTLLSGEASASDIDKKLGDVAQACRLAGNVSDALRFRLEALDKRRGIKAPQMDKKAETALKGWETMNEAYPGIMQRWRDYGGSWAQIGRKDWTDYLAARKKFDEKYAPLVKGTLLDGQKHFKGVKYGDLRDTAEKARTELRARWVKAKQKGADMEKLRLALEEDRKLSEKERARLLELAQLTSPVKDRELRLAHANAAGGALGMRELRLAHARAKEGSTEKKDLEEKIKAHEEFKLPEQVAAQKVLDDFHKECEKYNEEGRKIYAAREKRRKKLGLPVDFD